MKVFSFLEIAMVTVIKSMLINMNWYESFTSGIIIKESTSFKNSGGSMCIVIFYINPPHSFQNLCIMGASV